MTHLNKRQRIATRAAWNDYQLGAIVPVTEAEGPGKRFAIWTQGCPFRCAGCCNPQYLDFEPATEISVRKLSEQVSSKRPAIEGISLIGGEPFAQAEPVAELARQSQELGLSVMVFTGFRIQDLTAPGHRELLRFTDLLVDGRYDHSKPDLERRWIGSTNQQVHFLTERYARLRGGWPRAGNSVEIRLRNGRISINGFPDSSLTSLSRKLAQGPK